ncbi:S1 RNA-binding domain-containing protein 1-like [Watersipora subatra]|uniref:S1 RNA-binding domain-containing protein 1-like n=1 Tax=Watersipora subatra TaxID=2589382 RepID=UPI00355B9BFA
MWSLEEALSDEVDLDKRLCSNLVEMIEKEQCTLPFIARYRKNQTHNIPLEKLRKVFESLNELKDLKKKIDTSIVKIEKSGNLTEDVKSSLMLARSKEEIDFIAAPFKSTGGARTLAGKACKLGLDVYAKQILDGQQVSLNTQILDEKGKALKNKEISQGVQHVIADIISKDAEVLSAMKTEFQRSNVLLTTSKKVSEGAATKKTSAKATENKADTRKPVKDNSHKYEIYYDNSYPVRHIHSHQVLAINRAETQKYLTVKLVAPHSLEDHLSRLCGRRWPRIHPDHAELFRDSVADSYKRLILPSLSRQCRSKLKEMAEMSSVDTFGENLKNLLLQPPYRGQRVLGVDPGFTNGCKMAVISDSGEVLDTTTVYLHNNTNRGSEMKTLIQFVIKHNCSVIALGNGTGCRETEAIISDCISSGWFLPLSVKYSIVNEDGSSVYSVSEIAEKELPHMDQNHRSAVSIARRLQDPLLELIKIDPQHIGVGMYQHDVSEAKLKTRLDSVLSECVSFVGIDINTATEHVLSHVSGLNKSKAVAILKERERVGGRFVCREQLLNVKGLGAKSYEQCAGFITIRIDPGSKAILSTPKGVNGRKKAKLSFAPNPLDQTMIHPSSYDVAERFLKQLHIAVDDLGKEQTVKQVTQWRLNKELEREATILSTDVDTLTVIIEALKQRLNYDIRDNMTKPLFQTGKTSIESLQKGDDVTGVVRNLAPFGAFVDIGVHKSGLIHTSKMGGKALAVGNQVKVKILTIDIGKARIGLKLLRVL